MKRQGLIAFLSIVTILALQASSPLAQRGAAITSVNWPLHNLDLAGSRFSPKASS